MFEKNRIAALERGLELRGELGATPGELTGTVLGGKFRYADELISHEQTNGKGHIDLNRCNAQQLIDAGVRAENIYDSALCTVARNDLFFSYRKERGHERYVGRLMCVVGQSE